MKFVITKDGNVSKIKVNAENEKLREESSRVMALLPKMKSVKQCGKRVGVKYTLPVAIKVSKYFHIIRVCIFKMHALNY
ncbi:MAG: hypothetical protein JXQ93_07210 [Flavobacteriaceae bacterium]